MKVPTNRPPRWRGVLRPAAALVLVLSLVTILVGCGSEMGSSASGNSESTEQAEAESTEQAEAESTERAEAESTERAEAESTERAEAESTEQAEATVEYKLAVIDGYAGVPEGPTVTKYRALLDRIEAKCAERRVQIADLTVAVQKALRDEIGVEESLLNLLREFRVITAKLQGQPKCQGAFSGYAQIRVAQGP